MPEQLSLFVTDVRLPKHAREQYVNTRSYGIEWGEKHLAARIKQLGKILKRDGFRNSYKLRLWNVPGICFSMRIANDGNPTR